MVKSMFDAPVANGHRRPMPGVPWPVYIYTDSVQSVAAVINLGSARHRLHAATVLHPFKQCNAGQLANENLSMLFEGKSAGLNLQTLDSGANVIFISPGPDAVQRLDVPVQAVAGANMSQLSRELSNRSSDWTL